MPRVLFIFLILLLGSGDVPVAAQPPATVAPVTVAIVQDGPDWYFDMLIDRVQAEVADLQEREIQFLQEARFNAQWAPERVARALEAALTAPEVDLVLAAGVLVAQEAARPDRPLPKPVLAGFMQDAALVPFSPKTNFAYILSQNRIDNDMAAMRELFTFERLHVVVDEVLARNLDGVAAAAARLQDELDLPLQLITVRNDVEEALAAIPDSVEVLYVTPLWRLNDAERRRFYEHLAARGIRTFALLGQTDVDLGALAGLAPRAETRLARRLALNLLALADGRPARELPAELILPEQLVFNEQTMRRVAYQSSVGTLLHTRLVTDGHSEDDQTAPPLTLHQALEQALQHNIRLIQATSRQDAARQDHQAARGLVWPQLEAQAGYVHIDRARAKASLGLQPESRLTAGAAVSQLLWHDEVFSQIRAAGQGVQRSAWELADARLDVAMDTALRFFEALSAQALQRVAADQLERIQENLELARLRVGVGQTGPEDALLWESELARQTADLLAARAQVQAARARLNQALGGAGPARWQLEPVTLADGQTFFLDEELRFTKGSYQVIVALTDFWRDLARRESPALMALDAAIEAQRILTEARHRARYQPTVGVRAGYERVLDRQTSGSDLGAGLGAGLAAAGLSLHIPEAPADEWYVGVAAELPLFDGGLRRARAGRATADLRYLEALREDARQQTDLAVIATYAQVLSSQPAIRLSRTRVRVAQESLALIQDRYTRGAAGIVDVLDAQGRAFGAEQAAVLAVNRYLQDLTRFQRAIAWFAWLQPAEAQAELVQHINTYLENME